MGQPKPRADATHIYALLKRAQPSRERDRKKYLGQVNELFALLLTTWPFCFTKWRDRFDENGSPLELEERFGDGHYADRQKLLQIAVDFFDRRDPAPLPNLFLILRDARQIAATRALGNAKLLRSREASSPERRLHARAVKPLVAYRTHLSASSPFSSGQIVETIDKAILALDQMAPPHPSKLAHKRPVLIDLDTVRAQLSALGVPKGIRGSRQARIDVGCDATPKNLHEALLMAVGLIPYRTA